MENENPIPGRLIGDLVCTGKKFEPGSVVPYQIYLAPACDGVTALALYVLLEHDPAIMAPMLHLFMQEGLIPPGMVLFCSSGTLPATLPGGTARRMRAEELDQYGPAFTNFLVEELIPQACAAADVTLDPDPDRHFITGGSSGGMAAWNAVWFRNDYFRRAFLSSPTFSAIRGGEEPMVLVRKTETRPIHLYLTTGTEEPDYFFGSSLIAAQNAAYALEFAGYDFRFEQFNGEGHCCRRQDATLWRRIVTFVFANWQTQPVRTLGNQIRIRNLVCDNTTWEPCQHIFSDHTQVRTSVGTYMADGGTIVLKKKNGRKKTVFSGFDDLSALGISSDRWRLYAADRKRRFIYALSIHPDGSLDEPYQLASLHLAHDVRQTGASDLTVLADDRVLAATELGIQGIVSFGLTDLILPLPGDRKADRVEVIGDLLYAAAGDTVYCRPLKVGAPADDTPTAPATPGYDNGFNYNRSHFTAD